MKETFTQKVEREDQERAWEDYHERAHCVECEKLRKWGSSAKCFKHEIKRFLTKADIDRAVEKVESKYDESFF